MTTRTLRYLALATFFIAILGFATSLDTRGFAWQPQPAEAQSATCLVTQQGPPDTQLQLQETESSILTTGEANPFLLTGSYIGPVSMLPGAGAAVSTSESSLSCNKAGHRIAFNKSTPSVSIWVLRCSSRAHIRITTRKPAVCILMESTGESITTPPTPPSWTRGSEDQLSKPSSNTPALLIPEEIQQTPEQNNQGSNLQAPDETININSISPPCDTTGQLLPDLVMRTVHATDYGPRHLAIGWSTELAVIPHAFCITIEHLDPHAVPPGIDNFPTTGFIAGWHETWKRRLTYWVHRATIGGSDLPGMYPGGTYLLHIQALAANGDYGPRMTAQPTTNPLETLGPVTNAKVWEKPQSRIGSVSVSWEAGNGHDSILDLQLGETVTVEWRKQGETYSSDRITQAYTYNGSQVIGPTFRAFLPRLEPDTEYTFRFIPKKVHLNDGPPTEITYRTRKLQAPPAPEITEMYFDLWLRLNINLPVGVDAIKVYVRSGTDNTVIDAKGGSYNFIMSINIPYYYQENCVMIAGIVGTGNDAIEGPKSDEVCATHPRPESNLASTLQGLTQQSLLGS